MLSSISHLDSINPPAEPLVSRLTNELEVVCFLGQKMTKVMKMKEGVLQIRLELHPIQGLFLPTPWPSFTWRPKQGPWDTSLEKVGSGNQGGCVLGASQPGLPGGSLDSLQSPPLLPFYPEPPLSLVPLRAPRPPTSCFLSSQTMYLGL